MKDEQYAKQSDLDKLVSTVNNISADLSELAKESRSDIQKLAVELTKETTRLTLQVDRFSVSISEMTEQLKSLVESNRGVLIEVIRASPKLISSFIFLLTMFLIFCTTEGHKDVLKYLIALSKAKYGI